MKRFKKFNQTKEMVLYELIKVAYSQINGSSQWLRF